MLHLLIRAYANQNHTLCPESSSVRDHEVLQKVNEEALLGKEGARIWKQHFPPKPNSDNIIQVPSDWVNFLSVNFLNPDKFPWAKKFISSSVWDIIKQASSCNSTLPFSVPEIYHSSDVLACLVSTPSQESQEQGVEASEDKCLSESMSASSTSALHKSKKRKDNIPLVETEVRRSCKLQKLSKGFKQAVWRDKNCLACHAAPHVLSAKIVKSLNTSFCKVPDKETSGDLLSKRSKKCKGEGLVMEGNKVTKEKSKKWF